MAKTKDMGVSERVINTNDRNKSIDVNAGDSSLAPTAQDNPL